MNTPAKELSPAKMMALIVAIVVIGPVMFLFSRGLSLARGFDKVQVGDSADALKAAMGAPAEEAHSGAQTQYRYSSWPITTVYVVTLENGKVAVKSQQ
jgi:hypothetical protein